MSSETKTPLISVGILSFERPELLSHTLASVARQTYQQLEVLISDNGSANPEISSVISEFEKIKPGTRVFLHDQNRGAFWNFRFVLERAKGDFFIWLADDDFWSPDFLQSLVQAKIPKRSSLIYSACCEFSLERNESGAMVKERASKKRGFSNVLEQTRFDTDSIIYGLFDRKIGLKYAPLLKVWPVPEISSHRFPTVKVDFVSYAFLYGLLLESDFINASRIGGIHSMIERPQQHPLTQQNQVEMPAKVLGAASVVITQAYIHLLLAWRFMQAAIIARSPIGFLFAPCVSIYLFVRRIVKAALEKKLP